MSGGGIGGASGGASGGISVGPWIAAIMRRIAAIRLDSWRVGKNIR